MKYLVITAFLGGILYLIRRSLKDFRKNLKPFQLVGARVNGKVINVKVLVVDREDETVLVIDTTSGIKYEVKFKEVFVASKDIEEYSMY